uniref:Bcl-2-like protein 13 n=1 Tax=Oncorhynchus mykiss TaxID=8022 RepID=A0A8C7RUX8_ONCMY
MLQHGAEGELNLFSEQYYPICFHVNGWLLEGKVPAVSRGGDSGEVSSLSGEQKPDWLGPATLQLSQGDSGGSGPWQTESSLAESWSTVGDMMDPEDTKSLDSSYGVVHLAEERSENHSSISDMVHLEREEKILAEEEEDGSLGEEEELQACVMSVLGGGGDMSEFREEELDTQELLPSSELFVQEEPVEVSHATTASMPMPVWKLEPPSASSTPVPSIPTLTEAELATSLHATELPVLLCGGAAMVAIVGVLAYGAVAYCRK